VSLMRRPAPVFFLITHELSFSVTDTVSALGAMSQAHSLSPKYVTCYNIRR
jgi:hypothetical protein